MVAHVCKKHEALDLVINMKEKKQRERQSRRGREEGEKKEKEGMEGRIEGERIEVGMENDKAKVNYLKYNLHS